MANAGSGSASGIMRLDVGLLQWMPLCPVRGCEAPWARMESPVDLLLVLANSGVDEQGQHH